MNLIIRTTGPNGTFRHDPDQLFPISQLRKIVVEESVAPGAPIITRFAKAAMSNIEQATEIIHGATKMLDAAHNQLLAKTTQIGEQTKKVSGAVRDAQQKLADGLERMGKTVDLARLEKQVELLERAAAAMQTLADLDKSGHLSKFTQAVK